MVRTIQREMVQPVSQKSTYLPFILVEEILVTVTAAKEQNSSADLLALGSQSSTFLNEPTERSDTSAGTDHDDGSRGIRGQLEVGVADVNWDMDSIVLVAWTSDIVSLAVGIGRWVSVLLLLQSKKVVRGDTLDDVGSTGQASRLHNSSNTDLVLLDKGRG